MPRFLKFRTAAKGMVPGSLILIGDQKLEQVRIRVMSYDKDQLSEAECETLEEAYNYLDPSRMTWINIDGLHDPEIITNAGSHFNIPPLLLEDIMNTDHRPKYEEYEGHFFITVKMLTYDAENFRIESDQLSLLAGKHYVVTFQERVGTHFESLRERIRQARLRVRSIYPDYLAYAIFDCVVDTYIDIIGSLGDEIESNEEEVLRNPMRKTAENIYRFRTEMNFLRKTIRPLKEITSAIQKSECALIQDKTLAFYSDLNDHVVTALDATEFYQTIIIDQYNMYNTGISNKANDIMKVLTIFAAVFIPLTFIAGIYGMNFSVIPELKWQWGYLYFWGLIILMGGGLFIFFKRKKWF
jgi:magnesium transporter